MRSLRLPLAVLLGLAGFLSACASAEEPAPVPSGETPTAAPRATAEATRRPPAPASVPVAPFGATYLALGDSLTFGIGAPRPLEDGFPALVAARLRDAEPPIVATRVVAIPGDTAVGFQERRMDAVHAAIRDAEAPVALVTVGLGANEVLQVRRDPACAGDREAPGCAQALSRALDDVESALDGIVADVLRSLRDAGAPDARLLLLTYYNPEAEPIAARSIVGSDGRTGCDPAEVLAGLNDRIACIAERRGVELVDLYVAFLGREEELTRIGAGDVHPNREGYAVIASTIATAVRSGSREP